MSIFGSAFTEASVRNGVAYRLSIYRQTLTAANLFKIALTNPVGSGVNMVLQGTTIDSYASVLSAYSVFRGPTGALPATGVSMVAGSLGVIVPLNNTSARAPLITVAAGSALASAPFTGGVQTQLRPIYTNAPTKSDESIIILGPGTVLGFSFGNGVAADFSFNIIWSEESS